MAANKSPGIEKILVRTIKDRLPTTLPMITALINASCTRGIFPRSWKLAEVKMLITKNLPTIGLSLSCPFSRKNAKGLRLIKLCLNCGTEMSNGRLSTRESDNRELHSTVTSLIRTTNAIDEMKISGVVVLDIVKLWIQ